MLPAVAAAAALIIIILIQKSMAKKNGLDGIKYSAYFSSSEVYAGDYVYLYEEITNSGKLPVVYMKADTELPEGLVFVLLDADGKDLRHSQSAASGKIRKEKGGIARSAGTAQAVGSSLNKTGEIAHSDLRKANYTSNIQSMFSLQPGTRVRRRWRVYCKTRGEYSLNGVLLTSGDVLGTVVSSRRAEPDDRRRTSVTVLPVPCKLEERYTSSRYLCGDIVSNLCPVTDPVRICGSREYSYGDPMNRINWKSTAIHGNLMVNVEEKTVRHRFSVVLNMNSKEIEFRPDTPSDGPAVEKSIIACASVLDRIAGENLPVRLFVNAPADSANGLSALSGEGDGALISRTEPFRGKRDMIFALRTLAKIPLKISIPAEGFFDHIAAHPELYSENENLVIISSYLDARMMNLCRIMEERGVKVTFYITTSRNLIGAIPPDTDVWFPIVR